MCVYCAYILYTYYAYIRATHTTYTYRGHEMKLSLLPVSPLISYHASEYTHAYTYMHMHIPGPGKGAIFYYERRYTSHNMQMHACMHTYIHTYTQKAMKRIFPCRQCCYRSPHNTNEHAHTHTHARTCTHAEAMKRIFPCCQCHYMSQITQGSRWISPPCSTHGSTKTSQPGYGARYACICIYVYVCVGACAAQGVCVCVCTYMCIYA